MQTPTQAYPVRPRNAIPHPGRPPTTPPPSPCRYKTAHREQQKAGINVFTPTDSPHFETNEEVPLDHKVFHYACHRLQFTPDLDLFAKSENAQVTRFISAYQMTRSCGVNAFNYDWSEDAGYSNHPW